MVGKVFFFQAEDGIRDRLVTGVQTCALPIFVKLARKIDKIEIINNIPMLAVPTWDENDKIKKVASVVSKLKIIALGVVVLKYLSNVVNCSLLIIV